MYRRTVDFALLLFHFYKDNSKPTQTQKKTWDISNQPMLDVDDKASLYVRDMETALSNVTYCLQFKKIIQGQPSRSE